MASSESVFLSEQINLLDRILSNSTDRIYVLDRTGRYQYANSAGLAAMGLEAGDLLGKTRHEVRLPIDRMAIQESQWESVFQTGIPIKGETYCPTLQGVRHCEYSLSPMFGKDGQIEAVTYISRDLTEGKPVGNTLGILTNETRFAAIFQANPEAMSIARLEDGLILDVNTQFTEISGYTRSETIGHPTTELQMWVDPEEWAKVVTRLQTDSTVHNYESTFRHKSGRTFVGLWSGQVLDWDGQICVLSFVRDISDRKQAEAKLSERESLLHLFGQYAPIGIAMFDREMRYVMASQRWVEDYHPNSSEPFIGRSHYEVIPSIPERWRQVHQRSLAGRIEKCDEDCFAGVDGNLQWTRWEVRPWYTATGKIGGIIIFSEDITKRKQAELSLQELNQSLERKVIERTLELQVSEAQIRQQANREILLREITQRIRQSLDLQTIFDTACREILRWSQAERIGIFKFDPGSHFNHGAFVAEAILPGFPSVLATPIRNCCFGDRDIPLYQQGQVQSIENTDNVDFQDCHQAILAQFQVRAHLVVPLLQGNELWGLLCIHQCSAPRHWEPFEIQVAQEIANQLAIAIQQASLFEQLQHQLLERQQAQQQLAERNQQLALFNHELTRATRLKDEFLANMSHELRTPLNAILGMAEGLQEEIFGEVNDQQIEALQTIERTGLHLLELINDILDLAKVESGQLELHCTPTVITKLCQSSLDFIKQQAFKKQIQLELKLPPNLPDFSMDERRIRQSLVNLLNNAVKFTPQGGHITLEVSWSVFQREGAAERNWLRFSVLDTGIGIAPENIHKLFQPFVQIDSALNRQYEGTGLGLSLVKNLVELHGGYVGLTSEVGVGSCFTIDLPGKMVQPFVPDFPSQITSPCEGTQPDSATSPLILLVEDNEDNIVTVGTYLEAKGHRLVVARDGREAIALTQTQHPDLILMDIQMPGMDGLEAIRQIRRLPNSLDIPIIALTALAMPGDRERCLVASANDYYTKPVKLKQLATVIQQFLEPP